MFIKRSSGTINSIIVGEDELDEFVKEQKKISQEKFESAPKNNEMKKTEGVK